MLRLYPDGPSSKTEYTKAFLYHSHDYYYYFVVVVVVFKKRKKNSKLEVGKNLTLVRSIFSIRWRKGKTRRRSENYYCWCTAGGRRWWESVAGCQTSATTAARAATPQLAPLQSSSTPVVPERSGSFPVEKNPKNH